MSSSEEQIYVGDTGTRFNFTVTEEGSAVDLTGYSSLEIRLQRPDKTVFDRDLTVIDATTGQVRYTTLAGDLDQAGRWHFQLLISIPEWSGAGSLGSFWVQAAL